MNPFSNEKAINSRKKKSNFFYAIILLQRTLWSALTQCTRPLTFKNSVKAKDVTTLDWNSENNSQNFQFFLFTLAGKGCHNTWLEQRKRIDRIFNYFFRLDRQRMSQHQTETAKKNDRIFKFFLLLNAKDVTTLGWNSEKNWQNFEIFFPASTGKGCHNTRLEQRGQSPGHRLLRWPCAHLERTGQTGDDVATTKYICSKQYIRVKDIYIYMHIYIHKVS